MPGSGRPCAARAIELVLAAAGPASLDEIVGWEVARPTDLWRWLEDARQQGWVVEDTAAGAGYFKYRDADRLGVVIASVTVEEWGWLLARPVLAPRLVAAARAAARARQLDAASRIFRAIVPLGPAHAAFAEPRAYVETVVECVRLFRFADWIDASVLDQALSVAIRVGSLRLQALLAAARGFVANRAREVERARGHFERALEAARAVASPAVAFEVHMHVAFGQILQGLAHDAIATFERFLGDVPPEILPLPPDLVPPSDPLPELPLAILGSIYAQVGQYGRALELLHRLRSAGARVGRPELTALADSFLSGLHAGRRELAPARTHAEAAFNYWRTDGSQPYLLWHAAISLAWAHSAEDHLDEARAALEVGQAARLASGLVYFGGSPLFEVLERFSEERLATPPGLDIDGEIERMLAWPDTYMRAVANRFRARRLAKGEVDDACATKIDEHLRTSVELLSSSGACPSELARALEASAQWASRHGDAQKAARLQAQANEVFTSVDLSREPRAADPLRIATALVELGQVAAVVGNSEGVWGELAARLCALLGVERCALIERRASTGAQTVAARGGGAQWVSALERLVSANDFDAPAALAPIVTEDDSAVTGQLIVIPYASARLCRRGWAFLENRYSRALVSSASPRVLAALSAQLSVILENVAMWQALETARVRLEQENRYYRQAIPARTTDSRIVGDSPALRRVLELVARVAPATTTVLIQGETGVGKELVAREIHRLSPRSKEPFIAVHIASLAPGLVASSLFGHERGAFTGATEQTRGRFELADGGTLLLDEIGELSTEDQVRLLRVLQEGSFERVGGTRQLRSDFRLIAATNRDLAREVRAGLFREDLYFRLAAFPIQVPPLRERREEIPTLALYFTEAIGRKLALHFEGIAEADMARLLEYQWPGNVRELEHVIERAALLSEPPRLSIPPLDCVLAAAGSAEPPEWTTVEELERRYLRKLIVHTGGRISGAGGAAGIAGLKPSTLTWRIDKLGLRPDLRRARAERE